MRHLAAISLVLIVFFGSVGIPLYQHTCLHEDITIHTLFTSSDHCEEMAVMESEATTDACCKAPATVAAPSSEQLKNSHCCTDDMTRLAMSFHFFEQWQVQAAIIPQLPLAIADYLPATPSFPRAAQLRIAANSDPPPVYGRELLNRICVYRL